jgi:DNA-directed RNA polymerase sigma subunit (sigma70/sigma32)
MFTLIKPYEGYALPQQQYRARRCNTRIRKIQLVADRFPASPLMNNKPGRIGVTFRTNQLEVVAPTGEPHTGEHSANNVGKAIKLYLREIGQVKLLTPREELELVARIKKGGRKARERLITANLRRVVKISREYEDIGLPLLDLISEGNLGLLKAVERFDSAKGGNFSAYSSWWIKHSIKRALANQSRSGLQSTR